MIGQALKLVGTAFKFLILVVVVAGTYAYAMFQGGFVSWFLFYSVLTIIVLTLVVAMFTLRGFKVERKLSATTLPSGESIEVEVIVHKKRYQPFFYVRVYDVVPRSIGTSSHQRALFFFSFTNKLRFKYKINQLRRGEHQLSTTQFSFGDLFGIFEKKYKVDSNSTFLVYPRFKLLDKLPGLLTSQIEEGIRPDQAIDEERSLAGVRSYAPGDRLTSINWKQSARTAKLMTKEFETFRNDGAVILFDPYVNQASSRTFEQSVELAASLIATAVKRNPQVTFSIRTSSWQAYDVSNANLAQALRLLAKVQPDSATIPSVHKMYRDWRGKTAYVVCSELNADLVGAMSMMKEQKVLPHVVLPDEVVDDQIIIQQLKQKGVQTHILRMSGDLG
ncbi:DUF58 domain-containing protein [Alkalihalophilus lindianensis]|uniref:DUF58 domain-containing protein n=1 Tax=Alkalihalophilus lindianensis TaxID=1630542 RepID=A0ABU3XFA4_9BACI|nr:DUF58 domain-containing protein [Alkalihalophilus lindianensis]MDV2686581.1 DUF58 domain-containing protein [Alkalihalophilus lindianensis]